MNNKAEKRKEVMTILAEYGLDSSAVWDCHGTPVILHKALEVIAEKDGISFDTPQIIEANSKDKIAVVCVTGRKGDASAWSFGEAAPGNNKNAYPYAMAEKRAKDRVILKLIGLSGEVYSEEEADDFKDAKRESKAKSRDLYSSLQSSLDQCDTLDELQSVWTDPQTQTALRTLPEDWEREIVKRKNDIKDTLYNRQAAA